MNRTNNLMIRVENVSKMYHIGVRHDQILQSKTLTGKLLYSAVSILRRIRDPRLAQAAAEEVSELWALKNVSFELEKGEVLGIIGPNGSGKSTLLKILSHVTAPTKGKVELYGRVGSLLEIGTGFNPDLTGRENVYLNGAILGMKKVEIDRVFDEIVDFSGVEKFIDTPVKRYSSGMYIRLAFSVAAHFNPEILVLDEVLSVGDAEFQKKSLEKMERSAKSGKTVILVSHGLTSITRLCNKAIRLSSGEIVSTGNAVDVVSSYLKAIHKIDEERLHHPNNQPLQTYFDLQDNENRWDGYTKKIFTWVSTHRLDGTPAAEFDTGDGMRIRIGYHLDEDIIAYCQINFLDYAGTRVMQLHNTHNGPPLKLIKGNGYLECVIQDLRLLEGNYIIMLEIGDHVAYKWLDCIGDTLHISVKLGEYLGGVKLSQGQVVFAQKSFWQIY